jgi:hypothetical protein
MNTILFKLKGQIIRRLNRLSGFRPSSYPYLSGDTLRQSADMVFDEETNTVRPDQVNRKTVIFVGSPVVGEFFATLLPEIKSPFTLITHNGDTVIDEKLASLGFASGKIAKWFATNTIARLPNLVPVPAGLENLRFHFNGVPKLFDHFRQLPPNSKKPRILFGFSINTNPAERQPAFDLLSRYLLAEPLPGWPSPPKYLKILFSYMFVAAPPGNGLDTHRAWEALYLGVIPILKRSPLTESFQSLGLPIWIIDSWDELSGLSETDLRNRYKTIMLGAKNEALWADYWLKRIRAEE